MKSKAQTQFLSATAIGFLLAAGSFWAKISMENQSQSVENQPVISNSAIEAAQQILSTLPATTAGKPGEGRH